MANNGTKYINPYAFVRTDWKIPPTRTVPCWHNSFQKDTLTCKMVFKLTTKMPLFIKNSKQEQEENKVNEFCHTTINDKQIYLIPGSSLKGMVRSIVEAVGNGCYSQFTGSHGLWEKLPPPFRPCNRIDKLCIGCRLFGTIASRKEKKVYKGNVFFSDAIQAPSSPPAFENHKIRSIGMPRPWCSRLYLSDEDHIAGRKFYYHHQNVIQHPKGELYQTIKPGSEFSFSVACTNLDKKDFQVLLYSLVLEKGMWHKIGYGKADGFGSIHIECTEIIFYNPTMRYTGKKEHPVVYKKSELSAFIDEQIEEFKKQNPVPLALGDLKEILCNIIKPETVYEYDTYWNRKKRMERSKDRYYEKDNTGSYKKRKKWHTDDDGDMTFTF